MKIILVRDRGTTTSIKLKRPVALALVATLALTCTTAFAVLWSELGNLEQGVVTEWRHTLEDQATDVAALESRAAAENEAIGRQLAQMQARLLRMEALGARVSEVAELDQAEFSFDQDALPVVTAAGQGGPVVADFGALERAELQAHIDQLALQIREREVQLELIESLLLDDEYRRVGAPAGRPITWGWVSSPYGRRIDPITGRKAWHAGVDFAGKEGSDVITVASGIVVFAGRRSGYGNMVEVSHADGYTSAYGHSKEILVAVGDVVHKGQRIATMGRTGRATGPHVHFEVRKNGKHVDPAVYVARI
jgi:murein DD-endopeptidase MepM/ murein hydrolase activator NlpD